MSTHLEIEAKYDLTDGQAIPDLIGHGGVDAMAAQAELVLTADYFDTADLALASAGATLRRRTGGTDDGWHLKLPVADGERLEVHRALGRSQSPPTALTALVRAIVRAEPLVPVATLVNARTAHRLLDADGRVLAELADDSVTGERHDVDAAPVRWREIEIELVDGDRDCLAALDEAVRAGGAVPATGPSKVGRVLGAAPAAARGPGLRRKTLVGEVLDAGVRRAVHDLVVTDPLVRLGRPGAATRCRDAVRRLGAVLALRNRVGTRRADPSVRAELAWLDETLAGVEQLDETRLRIREVLAGEPRELVLGPVGRRADRELAAGRRTALAAVRETLESSRYLQLLDTLAQLPTTTPAAAATVRAGDVLPDLTARALRRAERRITQLLRAQAEGDRRRLVEAARRAVERARCAEALAAGVSGLRAGSTAGLLDEASALLADLDASTRARDLVRDLGVQAHLAGENGFTFGRLHGLEDLRAERLLTRVSTVRRKLKRLHKG